MSTADFDSYVEPLWNFLAPTHKLEPADVIFVFGGLDLKVPQHAAQLYRQHFAPNILVTGASGPLTQNVFRESEARVFAREIQGHGVPESAIILEESAKNTGDNVDLGMAALAAAGISPKTAILVAKPFLMRRCLATFALRHPQVHCLAAPPYGPASSFLDRDIPTFTMRLADELARLRDYANKGFTSPIDIPIDVEAREALIRLDTGGDKN